MKRATYLSKDFAAGACFARIMKAMTAAPSPKKAEPKKPVHHERRQPTSEREARDWISKQIEGADVFREIATATERHRVEHGCTAYATSDGPLLGVLARAVGARRILEIGTALGYSAAWLAFGAPEGRIDTIEADASHAEAAEAQLRRVGVPIYSIIR